MAYSILIVGDTLQDIQEIYDWYESKVIGLGERFLDHFDNILKRLEKAPLNYKTTNYKGIRKAWLKEFPYFVYYRIEKHRF